MEMAKFNLLNGKKALIVKRKIPKHLKNPMLVYFETRDLGSNLLLGTVITTPDDHKESLRLDVSEFERLYKNGKNIEIDTSLFFPSVTIFFKDIKFTEQKNKEELALF